MRSEPRVVFVQKFVPHYRLPFFERFREKLGARGIELVLVYGEPDPFEGSKVRTVAPEWGIRTRSRIVEVRKRYLYYQGAIKHVRRGDLVIVEHAAKLLDNYLLYAGSRLGRHHFGYFGHGENFLADGELGISRRVKRAMLRNVSRWFAYTETSRRSLLAQGVAPELVTVVDNTLAAPPDPLLGIDKEPGRFVYIGGLYEDKRIDLLLDAAARVAADDSGLQLHVLGDGPLRATVEAAAERHGWLHYRGSLYGAERDLELARAQAILMPGAVGLVAVDSFHFRAPILTRASRAHGPEIAYLEDGVNALFASAEADAEEFAALIRRVRSEPALAARLQHECAASADAHTIEAMADRFTAGVVAVLGDSR